MYDCLHYSGKNEELGTLYTLLQIKISNWQSNKDEYF
jgi:hypothetical protein